MSSVLLINNQVVVGIQEVVFTDVTLQVTDKVHTEKMEQLSFNTRPWEAK